jgi:hypothetical protein
LLDKTKERSFLPVDLGLSGRWPPQSRRGFFFGFTLAQLQEVQANVVQKIIDFGPDRVASVSMNGQALTFTKGMKLEAIQAQIQNALNELDSTTYPETVVDRTVARFQ